MKNIFMLLAVLSLAAQFQGPALADTMSSANYQMTTTTMSGGGGVMSSTVYQMNGTLGQPSPLMDPADPPWSTNYDLYPGFWYTLDALLPGCAWDLEPVPADGDVDGSDLSQFAFGFDLDEYNASQLAEFANQFGLMSCF